MRVYIAGIRLAPEHEEVNLAGKTLQIQLLLETIYQDAMKKFQGEENALVFVVMCEDALTSRQAVPNDELQLALALLGQAVKQYKNMILIPGTYTSVEVLTDEDTERKRNKSQALLSNYKAITTDPEMCSRYMIVKARDDLARKTRDGKDVGNYQFLSNCSYLLTSMGMWERHKSVPYFEYNKVPNQAHESIFNIGNTNPVVKISTEQGDLNIGVLVCIEQLMLKLRPDATEKDVPIFQAVLSSTVVMDYDLLFAALTMQMDSKDGLNGLKIVINYNHCHAHLIGDVYGYVYDTNNIQCAVEQVGIIGFRGKVFNDAELAARPKPEPVKESPDPVHRGSFVHFQPRRQQVWPRRSPDSDSDKSASPTVGAPNLKK